MNFDMNTAWSRATELVKENFQLLLAVAAVFFVLPAVGSALFTPDFQAFADPNADPEVITQLFAENLPVLVPMILVSLVVQFAGSGALIDLMGPRRPTVGQAIATGFKVTLSTVAVFILYFLAYFVAAMVIVVPFALLAGLLQAPALVGIVFILILPISVYIAARMSMSLPVLVLEGTLNPITAIMRSFKLTHKKQWPVTVFWTVLGLCYVVISLLASGVFSVIAAFAGGGTASALILGIANGVWGMIFSMLMCALAVAIYQQLNGPDKEEMTSVFE